MTGAAFCIKPWVWVREYGPSSAGLIIWTSFNVSTPNGCRDNPSLTHVMAQEFQQHPLGILETGSDQPGSMNLVIPRLLLSASRSQQVCSSSSLTRGWKKVNPPVVQTTLGNPYSDVCARNESLGSCSVKGHQVAEFRCHLITAWSGHMHATGLLEINPLC